MLKLVYLQKKQQTCWLHTHYISPFNLKKITNYTQFPAHIQFRINGKIYKWFLKNNNLEFKFNHSHPTHMYFQPCNTKLLWHILTKKQLTCFVFTKKTQIQFYNRLFNIRKYNIFTHNGIMCSPCAISKKQGKISTYL